MEYEGPHGFGCLIGTLVTTSFLPSFEATKCLGGVLASSVLCPSCATDVMVLGWCTLGFVSWFVFQVVLERLLPCALV